MRPTRNTNSYKRNDNVVKANKKDNKVELKGSKNTTLKTFKISKEAELLEFLFAHITNDSKNNIKHYLKNHQILVNGACVTQFNYLLCKDDVVTMVKIPVRNENKEKVQLDIIYEDSELIVINKPSGLLSIESDDEKSNTAYSLLTDYVNKKDKKARIYVVHRIDRDTSGVLVVAKNEKIRNALQHNWQDIVKVRKYVALCEGTFEKKQGTVKSYLKENVNHMMYSTNDKTGQLAITHYQVLKENGKYSLVDVNIDSGRKNQIRVHMGDLGHKVVGDNKYGPVSNPINRLGLHASILTFIHPLTKQEMTFKAKLPSVFNSLFK